MPSSTKTHEAGAYVARTCVAILTILAIFVPLHPRMPGVDLDSAWMMALNQAVADGLRFGDQVIFTFGPYASIYTLMFHPATDARMLGGSAFLAAGFCAGVAILLTRVGWWWMLAFCLAISSLVFCHPIGRLPMNVFIARDALFFCYYLVVISACLVQRRHLDPSPRQRLALDIAVVIAFAPLGLLPLIKGSFLALSASVTGLCGAYLFLSGQRRLALACATVVPITTILLWSLAAQPLGGLLSYVRQVGEVMAGYTEAMQSSGPLKEIALFLVAAGSILMTIALGPRSTLLDRALLLAGLALILFVTFKSAFVRHDTHALIASTLLPVAALCLFVVARNAFAIATSIVVVLFTLLIDVHYLDATPALFVENSVVTFLEPLRGLSSRLSRPGDLSTRYEAALETIRRSSPLPRLEGRSDVYSYGQSPLLASDNAWAPRPTLQSYVAFTPQLSNANLDHLRGPDAPTNLIFRVEEIDDRLPSLEDGPSWSEILRTYRPRAWIDQSLLLSRVPPTSPADVASTRISSSHRLGDTVTLPTDRSLMFARMRLRPTLAGRIAALLFKPPILQISVRLVNGKKRTFRLVSGMASEHFLLSPIVRQTREFAWIYADPRKLDDRRVASFSIDADGPAGLWADDYEVDLDAVDEPDPSSR